MSSTSTTVNVAGSAPALTALASASRRASAIASSRLRFWKIWSTSPDTWAMAAPTALATARWGTWTTSETPSIAAGTRKDPPPTATSGTARASVFMRSTRSEEHTSELQSLAYLVCRLLLEKKKKKD